MRRTKNNRPCTVLRREIAQKCLTDIETARRRIASGIARLKADGTSREAFAIMNRATTFSEGAA
jgi:hypothetical protein